MLNLTITPRFAETDALGHINNTVLPVWFEQGRHRIFEAIHPDMSLNDWPIILAKISVDFLAQIYFGEDVIIRTGIEKVGNTSVIVRHEAWQRDALVASGDAVMVYFDYQTNKPTPIPQSVRERLAPIMIKA
ncbi:MAG: acyl-CoA thioesterase [Cellvibrionales bacterium]|jgi:acyl-CoA thioester hydrolase|nr:acyl-CoA thioesterase [Cellvibrionales bacterium]MBT6580044.1 acyl-CoA thioesterase [Cellvibrionales bacterium]